MTMALDMRCGLRLLSTGRARTKVERKSVHAVEHSWYSVQVLYEYSLAWSVVMYVCGTRAQQLYLLTPAGVSKYRSIYRSRSMSSASRVTPRCDMHQ